MTVEQHAESAAKDIASWMRLNAHFFPSVGNQADWVKLIQLRIDEATAPLRARIAELERSLSQQSDEVCQMLGKALRYPWFKDDQKNFPGATEADGVSVGDHVSESLAAEAAKRIAELEGLGPLIEEYRQAFEFLLLRDTTENLLNVGRVGAQINAILKGGAS